MSVVDAILELLTPIVDDLKVDIYDVDFNGGVLKITVDKPGGIDLEAVADVNRRMSRAIDLHDPVPGKFNLEVSSPGLERKLRKPEHWTRALGEVVKVKLRTGAESERRVRGTVTASDELSATLQTETGPLVIPFNTMDAARTVFEWKPKPESSEDADSGAKKTNQKHADQKKSGKKGSGPKQTNQKKSGPKQSSNTPKGQNTKHRAETSEAS